MHPPVDHEQPPRAISLGRPAPGPMLILAAVAAALITTAGSAQAAAVYVASSCSGAPSPCVTDLQGALDNTSYSSVIIVANETFTGDFLISRSLILAGQSGAKIQRATNETYCLRVEDTSTVDIKYLDLDGRVAVYNSSDVLLYDVTIDAAAVARQVKDASDVTVRLSAVDGGDRGVDLLDSTAVDIDDSSVTSAGYGVVFSDSTVDITDSTVHGDSNALVGQDGNTATRPDVDAFDSALTAGSGNDTTWRWTSATASYTNCSPTPTETTSSSPDLVSLLSYTGWGSE